MVGACFPSPSGIPGMDAMRLHEFQDIGEGIADCASHLAVGDDPAQTSIIPKLGKAEAGDLRNFFFVDVSFRAIHVALLLGVAPWAFRNPRVSTQ